MSCECAVCALKIDFELEPHLLEEIEHGRCVIFAGAGISTETSGAHQISLYETLRAQISAEGGETFPRVVDLFENRPNGRQKLIEEIKSRFNYIDGWRDLKITATAFHKALATAPYFSSIITTNWDRYFEDIIKATPFVYDSDLAFWESADRPLLKIHGSIDNLSTLVASTSDYQDCEERLQRGRLGDILRHIFATKTVIFVGYSASDSDFQSVFRAVRRSMGRFARTHYLISPFLSEEQLRDLDNEFGIKGIRTGATHFIEVIKDHMRRKYCFAFDDAYGKILDVLTELDQEHTKFVDSYSIWHDPHLIFATSYQDGFIHCLQRIMDHRYTNDFADLHRVRGQAELYQERSREYARKRDYWNSSYFAGYEMGLLYFDIVNAELDERQNVPSEMLYPPFYYHPKSGYLNKDDYDKEVRANPQIHKAAYRQAIRFREKYKDSPGIVAQHTPFG